MYHARHEQLGWRWPILAVALGVGLSAQAQELPGSKSIEKQSGITKQPVPPSSKSAPRPIEDFPVVSKTTASDQTNYWVLAVAAALLVLLVVVFIIWRRSKRRAPEEVDEDSPADVPEQLQPNTPATIVTCTGCGKRLKVIRVAADKHVKCPICGTHVEMTHKETPMGRSATADPAVARHGFSLIEVLLVIAIMAVLMGLLMAGVQRARESANRARCESNLRQIGLAFQTHHNVYHYFPTSGIDWGTPPTYKNGVPAIGEQQGAGWGFQILPYLESENLWRGGDASTDNERQRLVVGALNSIFFCPTRRRPTTLAYADLYISKGPTDLVTHALCDYASNNLDDESGAIRASDYGSPLRIEDSTDGSSSTLLLGEKRLNLFYQGQGQRSDDNEGYTCGNDWDTMRNANRRPAFDTNEPSHERGFAMFGSSHRSGINFVFVDGSVHRVSFSIDPAVFSRLGSRADGQPLSSEDY